LQVEQALQTSSSNPFEFVGIHLHQQQVVTTPLFPQMLMQELALAVLQQQVKVQFQSPPLSLK
jgi:hypothetical protein